MAAVRCVPHTDAIATGDAQDVLETLPVETGADESERGSRGEMMNIGAHHTTD